MGRSPILVLTQPQEAVVSELQFLLSDAKHLTTRFSPFYPHPGGIQYETAVKFPRVRIELC
jgi:hypothetical protein